MSTDDEPGSDAPRIPLQDARLRRAALGAVMRSLLVATIIVVSYFLLPFNRSFAFDGLLALVGGLLVVGVALGWQIRAILAATQPVVLAVNALLVTVPVFLVLFATTYFLMARTDPSSWSQHLTRLDAMYFTVTVFATVGFGDITAVSQTARAVTTVQMVTGLILVGVIARVVFGAVHLNWDRRNR